MFFLQSQVKNLKRASLTKFRSLLKIVKVAEIEKMPYLSIFGQLEES
jgi:hypothetical protein